jgi:hypothetical protein
MNQERIAAGAHRHYCKRFVAHLPPGLSNWLAEGELNVRAVHRAEMVPLRPSEEGQDGVVERIADRRSKSGPDEG